MLPSWIPSHRAIGIEIQPTAVRVVVLSRCWLAKATIHLMHMAQRALPIGAVVGTEFTDVITLASAITDALYTSKQSRIKANRAVMALPSAAILLGETSVSQLALPTPGLTSVSLDALEAAVLAEAERLFRIEASELAIDWFQPAAPQHPERLMIAAAPRHYVETYVEIATQAELKLTAIDAEGAAALRACRFAAHQTLPAEALYSVIWLSEHQIYVWFVREHDIQHELFFSGLDLVKSVFIDRLQHQAQIEAPQQAFITGEIDMLNTLDLNLEEMGEALHCKIGVFDASLYCQTDKNASLSHPPNAPFAVAFGLALQGLLASQENSKQASIKTVV